jgi:hypothetical protein
MLNQNRRTLPQLQRELREKVFLRREKIIRIAKRRHCGNSSSRHGMNTDIAIATHARKRCAEKMARRMQMQSFGAIIRKIITHASSGYIPSTSTAFAGRIAEVRKFAAV